ncbi:MAG: hypothetical protein L6V81_00715 [Clostridium sp.]|nr:MAG: hypothetical protein L6V81_00715 [Clostridium sp.]
MTAEGYYASGKDALKEISGWELYEKTENGYAVVTEGSKYSYNVSMDQGTTKKHLLQEYIMKMKNVTKKLIVNTQMK